MTGELLTPENKEFTSDDNLFNYQAKIIKDLAAKESCVIWDAARIMCCASIRMWSASSSMQMEVLPGPLHGATQHDGKEMQKFIEKPMNTEEISTVTTRDMSGRMREIMICA